MTREVCDCPSSSDSIDYAIVGAGVGGLATALALRARGKSVTVFERAPELKDVGAGILLSPNGVAALEFLGLRADAQSCSRTIREWRILNERGRCLQRMRPLRGGFPAFSLHRADLQALLLRRLGNGVLQMGRELTYYVERNGGLELCFSPGSVMRTRALVGADGLRSAVRATRFGNIPPRYSGYIGWRGVASWIPEDYSGEYLSETWAEGKRFGISPMGNGRCYWYATANRPENCAASRDNARETLLSFFRHWHRPITDLIEGTPQENILTNAIFDRPSLHPWTRGAVTLLGDAAHPMTPNLGQGACCALEDACVLAQSVERHATPEDAFLAYERARAGRTGRVQRASWWLGKLIQLQGTSTTALRAASLRLTPVAVADASMRWLFEFKL